MLLASGSIPGNAQVTGAESGPEAKSGARKPASPEVKRIASTDLPALAAAMEANLLTGQYPGGKRVITIRKKNPSMFPAVEWMGLRDRDTIQRVNGVAPRRAGQFTELLRGLAPGAELTVAVLRDGVQRQFVLQVAGPPAPVRKPNVEGSDGIMVLREDLLEAEWADQDPWTLLVAAAPAMARDANGNVLGVTSASFSEIPFAAMLGLRSGDIIQSVNGYAVDSERAIVVLINELNGERFFTAVILRDGKPLTLRYRVE